MSNKHHPYNNLPKHQFWKQSVTDLEINQVDPVVSTKFVIENDKKIATAGSCFAQHMSKYLAKANLNFLITETGPTIIDEKVNYDHGFGLFSARFGNIYTARQLLQLWMRANGEFTNLEKVWVNKHGNFVDPLRPGINKNGFMSIAEFEADQKYHLYCVNKMFKEMDIFIFTLGLTETWVDRRDGTVFPICPGVVGGNFLEEKFEFKNFNSEEIVKDLNNLFKRIENQNPNVKFILTVSPVPLIATAEDRHVLVSTTLSKSVLRVSADKLASMHKNVAYFPSYEIITGNFNRGSYFENDLRSVKQEGVDHVMRLFMKYYGDISIDDKKHRNENKANHRLNPKDNLTKEIIELQCEEELLAINNNQKT